MPLNLFSYDITSGELANGVTIQERISTLKGNLSSASDIFELTLSGISFPVKFDINSEVSSPEIHLHIATAPSHTRECLHLQIIEKKQEGYIRELSALECPSTLSGKKIGDFVLQIVDRLATTLGIRKVRLEDISTFQCQKTGQSTSLSLLHLMQQGTTWYESRQ